MKQSVETGQLLTIRFILFTLLKFTPLLVPLIMFLVVQRYHLGYIFPANDEIVDYWFLRQARDIPVLLALCLIPLTLALMGIWIAWRIIKSDNLSGTVGIITSLALLLTNFLACISTFGIALSSFEHFDRVQAGDHVYYLDSIWKIGVGHDSRALFAMFECDREGVMCKIVYSKLFHPTEEEYEAMQAELIVSPDGSSVLMRVDGINVYTHRPS